MEGMEGGADHPTITPTRSSRAHSNGCHDHRPRGSQHPVCKNERGGHAGGLCISISFLHVCVSGTTQMCVVCVCMCVCVCRVSCVVCRVRVYVGMRVCARVLRIRVRFTHT